MLFKVDYICIMSIYVAGMKGGVVCVRVEVGGRLNRVQMGVRSETIRERSEQIISSFGMSYTIPLPPPTLTHTMMVIDG